METFQGYRRLQGLPGVRNSVAIIPSVFCANTVARRIAEHVAGAVAFCHPVGCSQVGLDLELTARGLKGLGKHPNFYGVVVVGLGCERLRPRELQESIAAAGKPVEMLVIQEEGDTLRSIEKGITFASRLVEEASRQRREEFPLSELSLGLKCGGTDATSGLAANPALGWVTDRVVAAAGRAIFTEVTELIGAEQILAGRGKTPQVAGEILTTIGNMEKRLSAATASRDVQAPLRPDLPGERRRRSHDGRREGPGWDLQGGDRPDQRRAGLRRISGRPGLYLLDCVGHDGEAVTGLVASGCQVVVFTTGRGTPTGFPGVPVIKVTGNSATYDRMKFNLDFNAGRIMEGTTIAEVGMELFEKVLCVASGELSRAELLGHDELFCITRI